MNNEEFERKMGFIVEQHARFAADIQEMRGVQEQLQATQLQTENVVGRLSYLVISAKAGTVK